MSVIGISPSDIVAGGKAIAKVISALQDGGARDSFREADGSLQDRIAASELLEQHFISSQIHSPGSTALAEVAKQLRTRDKTFKKKQDKFRRFLGSQSTKLSQNQVSSALKWAFKGERDFQEHNNRVGAGVHATILNGILCASELSAEHHKDSHTILNKAQSGIEELKTNYSLFSAQLDGIDRALTSWIDLFANRIDAAIYPKYGRLDEHAGSRQHIGVNPTESKIVDHQSSTQAGPLSKNRHLSRVRVILEKPEALVVTLARQTPVTLLPGQLVGAFLVLFCFSYHRDEAVRALSQTLLELASVNPFMGMLLCFTLSLFLKMYGQIPPSLSFSGGDAVQFEDALGIRYTVPFATVGHFKIFKAFLEVQFEGRPGYANVMHGDYEIFSDKISGKMILREDWTEYVKPRTRLVMSMILREIGSCRRCRVSLLEAESGGRICPQCHQKFRSLDRQPRLREPRTLDKYLGPAPSKLNVMDGDRYDWEADTEFFKNVHVHKITPPEISDCNKVPMYETLLGLMAPPKIWLNPTGEMKPRPVPLFVRHCYRKQRRNEGAQTSDFFRGYQVDTFTYINKLKSPSCMVVQA